MKLPLLLVSLVVLTAALSVRVADGHDDTSALQDAVQQAADRTAAVGGTMEYDDAVRVGPALVPVRVAVRTARGGVANGPTHSTVRTTGPGGVPVVATATRAG